VPTSSQTTGLPWKLPVADIVEKRSSPTTGVRWCNRWTRQDHRSRAASGPYVTATFRMLCVFVVIEHGTRRLAHVNVTTHPSAAWTLQQLREVIADADAHKYLIHDRDSIFARHLDDSIRAMGLGVLRSPYSSPKANAICERVIGTIRRECLDWDDSTVRVASPLDPARVGCTLQRRASAQCTGTRCTRASRRICTNLEG
jgi:hypothetical protein